MYIYVFFINRDKLETLDKSLVLGAKVSITEYCQSVSSFEQIQNHIEYKLMDKESCNMKHNKYDIVQPVKIELSIKQYLLITLNDHDILSRSRRLHSILRDILSRMRWLHGQEGDIAYYVTFSLGQEGDIAYYVTFSRSRR